MDARITKIQGSEIHYAGPDCAGWVRGFDQGDGTAFLQETGQIAKEGDAITITSGPAEAVIPSSH